jgi:hypothetical protein
MLGKSFRSLARVVLPRANARKLAALALVCALAGCGGGAAKPAAKRVTGSGYSFQAPADWKVTRSFRAVAASSGGSTASVTVFRLSKPFKQSLWPATVRELDAQLEKLAATEKGKLVSAKTVTVAGLQAREYRIDRTDKPDEQLVYVLRGRREYQLYCNDADACSMLVESFTLA